MPGQSLVDADAADAPVILDVIRALELPLVLIFNKGRVMTMPQGVSKGTGLHAALDILRLSARNTLAIGDAENDHELLRLAEVGVAVPWGSAALRARRGHHAVRRRHRPRSPRMCVTWPTAGSLPAAAQGRRRLLLGHTEDGREFWLAARGRNVLIAGDTKSGKSWVAGLLCEQLILHGYCVCVIDPEGDYRSLEALPGVTILGGEDPPPSPRDVMRALRYPDRSVVIDLSRLPQDDKLAYIRSTLAALNQLRQRTGLPHRIVIDEAHYFLHDGSCQGAARSRAQWLHRRHLLRVAAAQGVAGLDRSDHRHLRIEPRGDRRALPALRADAPAAVARSGARLGRLRPGQAIVLPITAESEGRLRLFNGRPPPDAARPASPKVRGRPGVGPARLRVHDDAGGPRQDAATVCRRARAQPRPQPRAVRRSRRLFTMDQGRVWRSRARRGAAGDRIPASRQGRSRHHSGFDRRHSRAL